MNTLYDRIYTTVCQIPHGQVASYGQIARLVDLPHGARLVGWALRAMPSGADIPWQRVVAKGGKISIVNPEHTPDEQCRLLEAEGNQLEERDGRWCLVDPTWFMAGYEKET
jgi:methylated-DNA-protein-cysteine methyltransferase-like protein